MHVACVMDSIGSCDGFVLDSIGSVDGYPIGSGDGPLALMGMFDSESTLSWLGKTAIKLQNTYKFNWKKEIKAEAKQRSRGSEYYLRAHNKVEKILAAQIGSYAQLEYAEEPDPKQEQEQEEEEEEEEGIMDDLEQQMDHVQDQMQNLLASTSTNEREVVRSWCKSKQSMRTISRLQSISTRINDLRRLNPDIDQQLKVILMSSKHESSSTGEEEFADSTGEEEFAAYRRMWELVNGNNFEEFTALTSMLFTSCTPGRMPWYAASGRSLQVYSIKITEIIDLEWPLLVYGIIVARDTVDSRRNPLFLCPRDEWQCITQQDPFLRLTGPTRAILCQDEVSFEIQLKLKGRAESEDRVFISSSLSHNAGAGDRFCTLSVSNRFCKIELCVEQFKHSVQATIMDVHVVEHGSQSPFPHGGQVVCSSLPRGIHEVAWPTSRQILLVDSVDGRRFMDDHGYIDLQRNVVSAELRAELIVCIKVYSPCGDICGDVHFTPKKCNFSKERIVLGDTEVEVTVAWSLLVSDDASIQASGHVDPFGMCPPLHPSLIKEMDWSVYA